MSKYNNKKENNIFSEWKHDNSYCEKDKEGNKKRQKRFVGIPHSLLMNLVFLNLSYTAKIILFYMYDYSNGNENTVFPKSIYTKITTCSTFNKSIKELIEYGFVEIAKYGKCTREENIYKFSSKWKSIELPQKSKKDIHENFKRKY